VWGRPTVPGSFRSRTDPAGPGPRLRPRRGAGDGIRARQGSSPVSSSPSAGHSATHGCTFAAPPEAHIVKSANGAVPPLNEPVTDGIVHHLADPERRLEVEPEAAIANPRRVPPILAESGCALHTNDGRESSELTMCPRSFTPCCGSSAYMSAALGDEHSPGSGLAWDQTREGAGQRPRPGFRPCRWC